MIFGMHQFSKENEPFFGSHDRIISLVTLTSSRGTSRMIRGGFFVATMMNQVLQSSHLAWLPCNDLKDWITSNVSNSAAAANREYWQSYFSVALRWIWHWRNSCIWHETWTSHPHLSFHLSTLWWIMPMLECIRWGTQYRSWRENRQAYELAWATGLVCVLNCDGAA